MQVDEGRKDRSQQELHSSGKEEEESPSLTPHSFQRRMLRAPRLLTLSPAEQGKMNKAPEKMGEILANTNI